MASSAAEIEPGTSCFAPRLLPISEDGITHVAVSNLEGKEAHWRPCVHGNGGNEVWLLEVP